MFREHLRDHQYAPVPIQISYDEFCAAAGLFLNFLERIPQEEKRKVHFESPYHRGTATGYCDVRNEPGKDPKEYVHINPDVLDEPAVKRCMTKHEAARLFFECGLRIYNVAEKVAVDLFRRELPALADRVIVDGRLGNAYLRFLCYSPQRKVVFNAKEHYDKGQGTLALAESSPGLRIGCCRKHPLQTVRHASKTALFMPGDLMFADSGRTIIPAWHDVVVPEEVTPISDRCERWAIVFFINDKDGRYSEWDAVHNPLDVHNNQIEDELMPIPA